MRLLCKAPGCTSGVLSKSTRASYVSPGHPQLLRSVWHRTSSIGVKNCSRFLIECKKKRKKALKRSGNAENETVGSMKEYLELGMLLGDSADETISRVEERFVGLDMNVEAQELKGMLEEKERRAKKMDDLMNTVMRGGLDLKDSDLGGEAPMWASNDKFDNAWDKMDLEISGEDGFGAFMSSDVDYLENEDDLPEDFSYEDFENMIAKLPDNLMDGTFSPPSPPSAGSSSRRRRKTPKAIAPTPELVSKPSSPQPRNFEEFEDMLRDQMEHPSDFLDRNFEVVSETKPTAKKPAIIEPMPTLQKPGIRLSQEMEESDSESENIPPAGDVVADFVVPEFKRPKLEQADGKKNASKLKAQQVSEEQNKKKPLEDVPEMRPPVRKMESKARHDSDSALAAPVKQQSQEKPGGKVDDFKDESPSTVLATAPEKTGKKKQKRQKPKTTPIPVEQNLENAGAKEVGPLSSSEDTEGLLELQEIATETSDAPLPELHKPALVAPSQEAAMEEAPEQKSMPGQDKGRKRRQKKAKTKASGAEGKEKVTEKVDTALKEAEPTESEVVGVVKEEKKVKDEMVGKRIAEDEDNDDRVLQELSFDESEPSQPVPPSAGKPGMPSEKQMDLLARRVPAGRANVLLISGEPMKVKVVKTIHSGVFVRGGHLSGFLPFSLMAAGRMRYFSVVASKKQAKIKKGVDKIKFARQAALSEMMRKTVLVQLADMDAETGRTTFNEMGSTQATCPGEVMQAMRKNNLFSRKMTAKVLATTDDATYVAFRLQGFDYPITGIIHTEATSAPTKGGQKGHAAKKLKYGDSIDVIATRTLENNQLVMVKAWSKSSRKVVTEKQHNEVLHGTIPEVAELCRLLEERPFISRAAPGDRKKVPSSTSSFQVLMGKHEGESAEGLVEMTLMCRLDNEAQEIKILTAHDKTVIKGIIESITEKM